MQCLLLSCFAFVYACMFSFKKKKKNFFNHFNKEERNCADCCEYINRPTVLYMLYVANVPGY